MSPELLATLWKWQASDDPVERAHAAWRLAQPDFPTSPAESDAARAARLIAELDAETRPLGVGRPCGGCPDR